MNDIETDKRREELLEVYKLYMARYNAALPGMYYDVKFYGALAATVLGGTIVLLKEEFSRLPCLSHFSCIVFIVSGGLVWMIAWIGRKSAVQNYSAWLRTVSTLIKLEHDLGLAEVPRIKSSNTSSVAQWPSEPYVYPEWPKTDWVQLSSSKEFVNAKVDAGFSATKRDFFTVTKWAGGLLAAAGFLSLMYSFCCYR